jgi:hypothetical protein
VLGGERGERPGTRGGSVGVGLDVEKEDWGRRKKVASWALSTDELALTPPKNIPASKLQRRK